MRLKRLAICCVSAVLICASMIMRTDCVHANAVDKLTIKLGYFGWQPSEYVEKAVFPASDLYDMGTVTSDYTYWDGGSRVAIDSSLGVPLSTVLNAAGVDQSSIAQMDFWTADKDEGAFTSFTWQQLLGTKRYYFENLAACFEYEDESETNIVLNQDKAWRRAYRVDPMMALEEQWVWYEVGTEDASGTDALTTANRFRLNFGQASPDEIRTFNSAKQVHTIYITFSGTPQLTSKEANTNIKGKVGSTHQLKISAAAADEAMERAIEGSLAWYSSDPGIASVDENGVVTFNKKGKVVITANGAGTSLNFSFTVGDEESKKQEPTPEKQESKKKKEEKKEEKKGGAGGTGTGNGGGGQSNGRSDNISGQSDRSRDNGPNTVTRPKTIQLHKQSGRSFMLSDEASEKLRLAFKKQAPKEEASMSTHQEEMDKDAEQLKIKKKKDRTGMQTGLACGFLALCGMVYGPIGFKVQMGGKKWKTH